MCSEDNKKYFNLLELSPGASLPEIRSSYLHLKALYSGESIATASIIDDFPDDTRKNILSQIEEAYSILVQAVQSSGKDATQGSSTGVVLDDNFKEYLSGISSFSGPVLKQIREKLGIGLADISSHSKIRKQFFDDIENEKFSSFTADVYLRGYLTEYARYLSLDVAKVVADYMDRYASIKTKENI